jgi:hypothetical protein
MPIRSGSIYTPRGPRKSCALQRNIPKPPSPLASIKLGNPTNTAEAAAKGHQMSFNEADRFAQSVLPIIASIPRSGITCLRGLAIALNNRDVRSPRNGQWQVSNVRNILAREYLADLLL